MVAGPRDMIPVIKTILNQSDDLEWDMIPIIKTILNQSDDLELVTHTLWSLAYISADEEVLDELADLKHVLPKMVTWVQEASSSMTTPSLRIFGNLCSGSNDATQMVVDARGIPAVIACLLATQRETIKKECIWTLSNISAGTSNQVSALLEADCFPNVITTMREHSALRLECAYVLANPWSVSVKASPAVASKLIQQRVICELVSLLDADCSTAVLLVVLEGLSDAKKKGLQGGISCLILVGGTRKLTPLGGHLVLNIFTRGTGNKAKGSRELWTACGLHTLEI
eukprot:gene11082-18691_t